MTAVLPSITSSPFRYHFVNGHYNLSRSSPVSNHSIPSSSTVSPYFSPEVVDNHASASITTAKPGFPESSVDGTFPRLEHGQNGFEHIATNVSYNRKPVLCTENLVEANSERSPKLVFDMSYPTPNKYATSAIGGNRRHRHRLSDTSSAFVHTIRTASMSNGSFSVFQRSSKYDQSSDTHSFLASPRHSIDSDRPVTRASVEDAAITRAIRRQQIFRELIKTEESYIADLKALLYLYSTLLAANSTISSSLRTSMQRIVTNLLQIHESLTEKLHQIAYRAAARRWNDTAHNLRTAVGKRARRDSAGAAPSSQYIKKHSRFRSSLDSSETSCVHSGPVCVETADVLDVMALFDTVIPSFVIYEEYCASHEAITDELRKQPQALWSVYESGMESLARVLTAINAKSHQGNKGLTVGDLLIKPIQRICRYPLILDDLLRHMPAIDGPGAHEALRSTLQRLRFLVSLVNAATDNPPLRLNVQKRMFLRDRLDLEGTDLTITTFRDLGQIHLCGVLHVVYRSGGTVGGSYALCVLFDRHFMIATPKTRLAKFAMLATIRLEDLAIKNPDNGNGLQCSSTLFTFKVCFAAQDNVYEVLLSACSAVEEQEWLVGLNRDLQSMNHKEMPISTMPTHVYVNLKPVMRLSFTEARLSRQSSIQRAVTVADRSPVCQIILRNTYNPQDLQEYRNSSAANVGRSISHATSVKTVILAPKRSERVRLETILKDVWTKDRLPYPRMIASKGSQILRASAGSLVRKLSLASIHAPFSRRSASTTVSSKKSYDALTEKRKESPSFKVRRQSLDDTTPIRRKRPEEIPELDTMDNVIGRMIAGGTFGSKRLSFSGADKTYTVSGKEKQRTSSYAVKSDDSTTYYDHEKGEKDMAIQEVDATLTKVTGQAGIESPTTSQQRKRWSNPISKLKELGSERLKLILHHSKEE